MPLVATFDRRLPRSAPRHPNRSRAEEPIRSSDLRPLGMHIARFANRNSEVGIVDTTKQFRGQNEPTKPPKPQSCTEATAPNSKRRRLSLLDLLSLGQGAFAPSTCAGAPPSFRGRSRHIKEFRTDLLKHLRHRPWPVSRRASRGRHGGGDTQRASVSAPTLSGKGGPPSK